MTVVCNSDCVGDEDKMVSDFLKHLSVRQEEYTRDCWVPNATTGLYEEALSSKDGSNSGAASPEEGRRAPPPTPAALTAAIANTNAPLEPVPEDESVALVAPTRPASPESWSLISKPTHTDRDTDAKISLPAAPSEASDEASASSESTTIQVDNEFAYQKPSKTVQPATNKMDQAEKVDEVPAPPSRESAEIDPDVATYNAFTLLAARGGDKGLESSKFARTRNSARSSNASRPLASRDPNINGPLMNGYKEKMVQKFSEASVEDENSKSVRFSPGKTEVSGSVETPTSICRKPYDSQLSIATKSTPAATTEPQTAPAVSPSRPTPATDGTTSEKVGRGEDRRNALFFSGWGAPEARTGPQAQIRSVIITGLPAALENTQLASLIDGGVIESYRLVKNPTSVFSTAIVLFATGAAAKAYYDKYPNGLELKMGGKKVVATVEMGESVDVVSGLMRGYLETGATRVVRAEGADEDWAMRALRKIAEEKNRKCESIIDTVKEEGRTIEWRFTNIADAVAFRGSLIRDPDWEDCNIQFGQDPCAGG